MTRARCILVVLLGLLVIVPGARAAASGLDITTVEGQSFTGNVVAGLACPLNSATITWGDGTAESAGTSDGNSGIQGTHTYAQAGTYTGSVSYTYPDLPRQCPIGTQTASFHAAVQDAALSATGIDVSGTAGQPLSAVVAHIDDANPTADPAQLSAQIAWGDGTTTTGIIGNSTGGGFDVSGRHTYNTAGDYPVTTSITDVGGSTTSASSTAHIGSVAPPPPPPPPQRMVPATIILTGPDSVTSDLQPRFEFTSTIAGSTFECLLDPGLHGARWTACASPYTTVRLAAGKHTFKVRATSPEGVTDPTGAQRMFEIRPAASIEEHSCIKSSWDPPSLGASLFGATGVMNCGFFFSCPQWYDCAVSGSVTFSFATRATNDASADEVFAILGVQSLTSQQSIFCVRPASTDRYSLSGDTRYCSQAGHLSLHGQGADWPPNQTTPYLSCLAGTSVLDLTPGVWFDNQILGCHAVVYRTWAPGVAHAHPFVNLVRRGGNVFASPRAAVDTGFVASCPAGGGACAANVTAALVGTARAGAASAKLQPVLPKPSAGSGSSASVLGKASLKVRPGKRAKLTFFLTRRGAALLHKRHRLQIRVTITSPPARLRGRDTVMTRTLTIVDHR